MKHFHSFIIGFMALATFTGFAQPAHASVCGPGDRDNMYKKIYCEMKLDENKENDEKLVKTLSAQFAMEEEIIEGILANTICQTAKKLSAEDRAKLPEAVKNACLESGISTSQALGGWSTFTDIQNAYEKEKAMKLNSASLEFKFKASEKYWDGKLANSPFDLIVDLNLIEIILFGSQAQWLNDVYAFPVKEEEDGDTTTPLDNLLPEDSKTDEPESLDESKDPGLKVETDGSGSLPPDCVPPDDPDADPDADPNPGTGPGSDTTNKFCGDGKLDVLVGEQCDDGNKKSGDGCNQYCQKEQGGSGDQCQDPEAVNFKNPDTGGTESTSGTGSTNGSNSSSGGIADGSGGAICPPGSVPRASTKISGTEADGPQEVPQAFEYPGPFLGGTLKEFPESTRPPCGPGETPLEITVAGKKSIAKDKDGKVICARLEYCSDPNAARDFLFGAGWENDARKIPAEAIEAIFCVNVIKNTRPLTPYAVIEGCIDCHISAMVDSLEEALATNVTPLENTTSAFGISSKFAPSFSFNLNTAVKRKIKYEETRTGTHPIQDANRAIRENETENAPAPPSIRTPESPLQQLNRSEEQLNAQLDSILEGTHMYGLSSDVISDQEFDGRVTPLLIQMKESFENIQSMWQGVVQSTAFDKKKQCIP